MNWRLLPAGIILFASGVGVSLRLNNPPTPSATAPPTRIAEPEAFVVPRAEPQPTPNVPVEVAHPVPAVLPERSNEQNLEHLVSTKPVVSAKAIELTTEQIATKCEASIALIQGKRGRGTGFMVAPGILVTNAHVVEVEQITDLTVRFPSAPASKRGPIACQLLYEQPERDLAFLGIKSDLPPLDIAKNYQFRRGQEITIIGNPGTSAGTALENAISRGVMSTPCNISGQDYFQMSITINPGNSGGPVIDSTGLVVGVATAKDSGREGLGFCIPATDLQGSVELVNSLTPQNRSAASAIHDARFTCKRLIIGGQIYLAALDVHLTFMRNSVAAGRSLKTGIRQSQNTIASRVLEFDTLIRDHIYPDLCRLASQTSVSPSVRTEMLELWKNILEIKACAETPKATEAFLYKVGQLRRDNQRLVNSLETSLAISLK
jgi:S1-C subfamily serine protease